MDLSEYYDTYNGNDKYRRFFAANSLKDWGFYHFKNHFKKTMRNPPSSNTLESSYRRCLDAIQKDSSTPDSVKQELKKLLKENDNGTSSPAVSSNTYHLHQGDNSFAFVNSTNYGANMVGKEGPGDTTITEPRSEGSVLGKRASSENQSDQDTHPLPAQRARTVEMMYNALASNEPQKTPEPITPKDFRKAVYEAGVKVLNKQLSLQDASDLRKLLNNFTASDSLGEQLDVMSANLALKINLSEIHQVNALKLSLSRIVDTVNSQTEKIFRKHITNSSFWERVAKVQEINLGHGMAPAVRALYGEMIALGTDIPPDMKQMYQNAVECQSLSAKEAKQLYLESVAKAAPMYKKLDTKLLRIAIAEEKVALLKSDDTQCLQLLDILEIVAKACLTDPAAFPDDNDSSELTCYRKCTKILDEVLNGSRLQIFDGETTCKASKSIAKMHERVFGSNIPLNKGFGRRIDLILSAQNEELSTSEWKRLKVSPRKSLIQQAKNIRMNKAILSYLLSLPIDDNLMDNVYTVGMDFTGPMGYMFAVKRIEDVYVSRRLSTLVIPTYLDELPSFIDTLDRLYAWRQHHCNLKDIVLPAIRSQKQAAHFANICGSDDAGIPGSPNIYLTPTKKAHGRLIDNDIIENDEEDYDSD
ncbi:hypothetical protein DFQ28_001191 [Apophysomyces sp. BC1034]|nr:hypothetical protein DFQ28_001191 [Apophysomyces sp. BC1034]